VSIETDLLGGTVGQGNYISEIILGLSRSSLTRGRTFKVRGGHALVFCAVEGVNQSTGLTRIPGSLSVQAVVDCNVEGWHATEKRKIESRSQKSGETDDSGSLLVRRVIFLL